MSDHVPHVANPHLAGRLFDCQACEATCYCKPNDEQCVHCAIAEETRVLGEKAVNYIRRFTYR